VRHGARRTRRDRAFRRRTSTQRSRPERGLHDAPQPRRLSAVCRAGNPSNSFRMSKHDLQARPIYHHQRDSIEAHPTIVFAALAVSRWIENPPGWSIKKFVRSRRSRA